MSVEEEIAAVREAIASGVLRVRTKVNGVEKDVTYPSFDDLRRRLDFLTSMASGTTRTRAVLSSFRSGRSG